jgi:hypothetical protein
LYWRSVPIRLSASGLECQAKAARACRLFEVDRLRHRHQDLTMCPSGANTRHVVDGIHSATPSPGGCRPPGPPRAGSPAHRTPRDPSPPHFAPGPGRAKYGLGGGSREVRGAAGPRPHGVRGGRQPLRARCGLIYIVKHIGANTRQRAHRGLSGASRARQNLSTSTPFEPLRCGCAPASDRSSDHFSTSWR